MLRLVECRRCAANLICPALSLREALPGAEIECAWTVRKGQQVYCEHTIADGLFYLCEGSVKLKLNSKGETRIVGLIKPGGWFGFEALMAESVRMFSAVARENSTVFRIERMKLMAFMQQQEEALSHVLKGLASALHDSQRLALLLSRRQAKQGVHGAKEYGMGMSAQLKQVEIAELLGVSAETVSRVSRKLCENRKSRGRDVNFLPKLA